MFHIYRDFTYRNICQNGADVVLRSWYLGSGGGAVGNICSSSCKTRTKVKYNMNEIKLVERRKDFRISIRSTKSFTSYITVPRYIHASWQTRLAYQPRLHYKNDHCQSWQYVAMLNPCSKNDHVIDWSSEFLSLLSSSSKWWSLLT